MNLLTITLCALIKATIIIGEGTVTRLNTTDTFNEHGGYNAGYPGGRPCDNLNSSQPCPVAKFVYDYNYNTDTGIEGGEFGYLKDVDTDSETLEAIGSYRYTDKEGNKFEVTYTANENGFQPYGDHLPKVPLLIQKALEYIAKHPEENEEV